MQYNTDNVYGYNSGLGLKTSAFTSGSVQTAGIGSLRSDILYGSFRMRATVPSVGVIKFSITRGAVLSTLSPGAWRVLWILHLQG